MRKRYCLVTCLLIFILFIQPVSAQSKGLLNASRNTAWLKRWMSAWELLVKDAFHISPGEAPDMLFFDKDFEYRSGSVIPPGNTIFKGPHFFGRHITWSRGRHNGTLLLPDSSRVPVGLMSFAAPLKNANGFFVMAAPAYWKQAGLNSVELTQDQLITGVFLHEFSHSRQFEGFGRIIDSIEHSGISFPVELSDDIVQDIFGKDSMYTAAFNAEVALWYRAALAPDADSCRFYARQAMHMLKERQGRWFQGDRSWIKLLDDVFLSMEGLGQFAAVLWLIHPKGARLDRDRAVNGFRRKRNHWSQEEGLALFLVLNRLIKVNWERDLFSAHPVAITALLDQALSD